MKLAPMLLALALVPANAAQPPPKPDVMCDKGWCAIRADTLKALIEHTQKLAAHTEQLKMLCGWKDK